MFARVKWLGQKKGENLVLNNYQESVTKTFKQHKELTPQQARLLDWATGLAGEAGEVIELIKHHIFSEESLDKMELAKEMGDVLWYLTAMAESNGLQLSDVAALNAAKLAHRYNNQEYNHGASANRHESEQKFADTILYQVLKARIEKTCAPMNVIFIGPDGSGKTTLAKRVAEELGFKYHKCDYKQDDKPNLALQLLNSQINVVYDRFYYPDDVVYGKIKGEHKDDQDYWKIYNDVLAKMEETNTCIIYVTASTEELLKRLNVRGDEYIDINEETIENIKALYGRFMQFMDTKRIATTIIDDTEVDVDMCLEHCIKTIKAGQEIFAGIYDNDDLPDGPIPTEEEINNANNSK